MHGRATNQIRHRGEWIEYVHTEHGITLCLSSVWIQRNYAEYNDGDNESPISLWILCRFRNKEDFDFDLIPVHLHQEDGETRTLEYSLGFGICELDLLMCIAHNTVIVRGLPLNNSIFFGMFSFHFKSN